MADEALAAEAAVTDTPNPDSGDDAHLSIDDALNNAFAAVEGATEQPSDAQTEVEPTGTKGARERDEHGRFKAKDGEPDQEVESVSKPDAEKESEETPEKEQEQGFNPPDRFSADAKAAWKDAPKAVQAEINRAVTELESGINSYREKLAIFDGLDQYVDLAKQHGTSVQKALENYTNLEQTISQDPMRGLQMVAEYAGLNLRDVAAQIMGQAPDAVASQQNNEMRALKQEIARLEQKLGGVETTIQSRTTAEIEREVTAFAADKPRFDELSETIGQLISTGMAPDLPKAYEMAERLNPAPTPPAPAQAEKPKPDLSAQTQKGSLSIAGAPASGSAPEGRKPSSSTDEALDRAFSAVGL